MLFSIALSVIFYHFYPVPARISQRPDGRWLRRLAAAAAALALLGLLAGCGGPSKRFDDRAAHHGFLDGQVTGTSFEHSFFVSNWGKGGDVLKFVGTRARRALEELFGEKVFVRLWVKVSRDWSDNERALRQFGFDEDG